MQRNEWQCKAYGCRMTVVGLALLFESKRERERNRKGRESSEAVKQ